MGKDVWENFEPARLRTDLREANLPSLSRKLYFISKDYIKTLRVCQGDFCVNRSMRVLFKVLLIASLLSLTSCALFRNPTGAWTKAEQKLEATKDKIDANESQTKSQGRNYVYATKVALASDPNTNIYHIVESQLVDRALTTLGMPTMEDTLYLQEMVNNLTSQNAKLVKSGRSQLDDLDAKIISLQNQNVSLQGKLDNAEEKILKVGTTNAGYASKWTTLMKLVWWAVYIFIGAIVIKILSAVLPPPYNSIVSLVAMPIGLIIKGVQACIPEAKKAAGVVAVGTYDNTKLALSHIVEAIEEAKVRKPEAVKELEPFLKDATSKEVTRPLITEIKKEMGYV